MSSGPLVSTQFPYLPLTLHIQSRAITVVALVDTGFDGHVVLPPDMLPAGITPNLYPRWGLADSTVVQAPGYLGTVRLGRFGPFGVVITALGDEPIVGRGVTDRFAVTLDHGRRVIVAP